MNDSGILSHIYLFKLTAVFVYSYIFQSLITLQIINNFYMHDEGSF